MTIDLPWVLLRKGSPPLRFATRELGQRFYDQLRFNRFGGRSGQDAALFGPNGEEWYCARWATSRWARDDARRKRETPATTDEAEERTNAV